MQLPEPSSVPFNTLMVNIEKGLIKIPQFQRDFVWSKERVAKLVDSIVEGYPIGTFILWKTKEELRHIRNLGGLTLPATPKGDFIEYVLDGQQRLTSLFATLKGLKVARADGPVDDFREIYLDLSATEHEQIVITDISERKRDSVIRLVELVEGGLKLLKGFPEKYHDKLDQYRNRLLAYQYSAILVKEVEIDVATEIFTRLNIGGKSLSVFEIMVAKTYDAEKNFDLAEKYRELLEDLTTVGYETVSDATVLQAISCILVRECQKRHILSLKKADIISVWSQVEDAIKDAIEYIRASFHVPVSKLLPYNALLVPFAYFFFKHQKKPTGDTHRYLQDFFWRTSLSGRYSSAVEGKIAQDLKRIDDVLVGKMPSYDYPIDTSKEFIKNNGWFSVGRSYIKAILCIYAGRHPKSFSNNAIVHVSNDWLKQANSKNYHHFFPKAFMEKERKDVPYEHVNHILNITIVDDYLNKREIRALAPSKYMRRFAKGNDEIEQTMKTHLIALDGFGIWEDDFERFFDRRAIVVSKELSKRIIPRPTDTGAQQVKFDDYEEEAAAEETAP